MEHEKSMTKVRQTALEYQNRTALAHESSLIRLRQAEKKKSIGLDRQLLQEQEQVAERHQRRRMQLIDYENDSITKRMQAAASHSSQLPAIRSGHQLLQISNSAYNDEPD